MKTVETAEHLTMQIAKQVYGLKTAENAMIFFKNDYQYLSHSATNIVAFTLQWPHFC